LKQRRFLYFLSPERFSVQSNFDIGKNCDAAQLGERLMDVINPFTNAAPFRHDYTLVVIDVY